MDVLKNCKLCPRNCGVNRYNTTGVCGATEKIKIAHYGLHLWEEPIISGEKGSGTIFFSNCNLKCIFCQNRKISSNGYGKEISNKKFMDICLKLQDMGALNINLVTPTHYVPQIVMSLQKIKNKNLNIPIIYNTSSYENIDTINMLKDIVDVYLADLKYFDDDLGIRYSHCKDYFKYASLAIDVMYNQVGSFVITDGIIKRGLVVRVLVLPGHVEDAKKIIKYLYDKYHDNIIISIMNQYTPLRKFKSYTNLNRILTDYEYSKVINYACDLGIKNAFIQEGKSQSESFIPDFDCSKI